VETLWRNESFLVRITRGGLPQVERSGRTAVSYPILYIVTSGEASFEIEETGLSESPVEEIIQECQRKYSVYW